MPRVDRRGAFSFVHYSGPDVPYSHSFVFKTVVLASVNHSRKRSVKTFGLEIKPRVFTET